MLKYIKESVFNTTDTVIAHSCNCSGAFGAGVAKQIADSYPIAKKMYLQKYHSDGWKLGDIQYVPTEDGKIIANLGTQFSFGNSGQHVDYKALEICINKLLAYCKDKEYTVCMPMISSGLAGGDWKLIEAILDGASEKFKVDINIFVFQPKVKKNLY